MWPRGSPGCGRGRGGSVERGEQTGPGGSRAWWEQLLRDLADRGASVVAADIRVRGVRILYRRSVRLGLPGSAVAGEEGTDGVPPVRRGPGWRP